MYQPVINNINHKGNLMIQKKSPMCIFITTCIFIRYTQLISFCCVMVRKLSLQLSRIVVYVVTFCLYHGLDKCSFQIGPEDLVNLVYTRGRMNKPDSLGQEVFHFR